MQKVTLITVGKLKEPFFKQAADEYAKRLGGYCNLQFVGIAPSYLPEKPSDEKIFEALAEEGKKILSKIPMETTPVALCIEGSQKSSEQLSEMIKNDAHNGFGHMIFVIGGSYGLSDEVKNRCKYKLSMSAMTFPHRLAQIMLLEQIYRGYKIIEGGTYHK